MKTIFFISRSYPNHYDTGGGALVRKAQVDALKDAGYKVVVVLPNYNSAHLENNQEGLLLIPYKINERISYYLHSKGITECYLHKWVKNTIKYLKDVVTKNDIIFSTTGGEMGTLIIASKLKKLTQCKAIINYHDPITQTTIFNLLPQSNSKLKNKNKIEAKYLSNIDTVITSSKLNKKALIDKHSFLSERNINSVYFGYLKDLNSQKNKKVNKKTKIVYGGSFGYLQKPEILAQAIKDFNEIEVVYIGNHQNYQPLKKYKNICTFLPAMSYAEYITYLQDNADIGFVSLTDEYYGACVPSKIYEYINVGLPILGALPNGDAMDIINKKKYGLASHFLDIKNLTINISKITDSNISRSFEEKILAERKKWSFNRSMKQILDILQESN